MRVRFTTVLVLLLAALGWGCGGSTPSSQSPANNPPPPGGGHSGASPRAALHGSIGIEIDTMRGMGHAVRGAIRDKSVTLSPAAVQAHSRATTILKKAQSSHSAGQEKLAHRDVRAAGSALRPALRELSRVPRLPERSRAAIRDQSQRSARRMHEVAQAVGPHARPAARGRYQRATQLYDEAARQDQAGHAKRALMTLMQALRALDDAIMAQWPELRGR